MTRPGAHGADSSSMIVAMVFLVLAALAGALLVLNLTVRKKDVIQGGYVEKGNED
jgi:outer membrane protein assembly factor BamE (lipoprotein component of BamABCDE complex)